MLKNMAVTRLSYFHCYRNVSRRSSKQFFFFTSTVLSGERFMEVRKQKVLETSFFFIRILKVHYSLCG